MGRQPEKMDKPGDLSTNYRRDSFGRKEVIMTSLVFVILFSTTQIYQMEEIVVTATRYPEMLKDVALATVVIEKDEIEELHPLSLAEALKHYAGIDVKDYGTHGTVSTIMIRGIQASGVLVLINGHPLNSISLGTADLSSINCHSIERIEIVKGPVSSLYGANALGGVVNIITTKKYEKPEVHLQAIPSTTNIDELFQTIDISVDGGAPLGQTYVGTSGGYTSSDGYRHNSDVTHYYLHGRVGYEHDEFEVISSLLYDDKEYGLPGPKPLIDSLHMVPRFGDSTVTSLLDRQDDLIILGDVAINWHIIDNLDWNNTFFADRKRMDFHTVYAGWLGDTMTEDFDYLTHTLGMNSIMTLDLHNAKIVFGVDAHYDTLKTTKISEQTGDTVWHASSYNIGAWLEFKKKFNTITFIPSFRFDSNSEFGNFLSPQIGFIGSFIPHLLIKMSAARAFRAPTFNDLYWPLYGNPDLRPEHGWSYEARFESSPLPNLFTAVSLYLRNIKDRIFWLPGEDGMWRPQNVNHISIRGLEIELHSEINEMIGFSLEGTYIDARQKNNEIVYDYYDWIADTSLVLIEEIERDAAFTPKFTVSSTVNVRLPYESSLNLTGTYVGERINYYANYLNDYPHVLMDTKTLDAYVVVNAVFSKKFFTFLTVSLGAKNLFDSEYALQFGDSINDLDYPMPGRTLFAQLALDY
jgi:outer membrane cobalamin receptor